MMPEEHSEGCDKLPPGIEDPTQGKGDRDRGDSSPGAISSSAPSTSHTSSVASPPSSSSASESKISSPPPSFSSSPPPSSSLNDHPSPWGLRIGGGIAVLVLILLAVWIARRGERLPPPSRLFPPDTLLFIECPDVEKVEATLASLPLWKEDRGEAVLSALRNEGLDRISEALGRISVRPLDKLVEGLRGIAVAMVPNPLGSRPHWAMILDFPPSLKPRELLRKEIDLPSASLLLEEWKAERIRLPNDAVLFLAETGSRLILVEDDRLLEKILRATKEKRISIEDYAPFATLTPSSPPPLLKGFIHPQQSHFPSILSSFLAASPSSASWISHLAPEARLVFSLGKKKGSLYLETAVIHLSPHAPPRTRSFFDLLFWIVVTPILLIVAAFLLFLLVMAALALYYHLLAWYRGELSPPTPPTLPPLSPQLQEDLASSRRSADLSERKENQVGGKEEPS